MMIAITIASILVITTSAWVVRKIIKWNLCPICAGVAGTWAWLLAAHFWGYRIDLVVPAILMGGTVVGVMSKLEKLIEPKFILVWKTVFVISGFLVANSLITGRWLMAVTVIIFAVIVTLAGKMQKIELAKSETEQVKELKNKMKNCC